MRRWGIAVLVLVSIALLAVLGWRSLRQVDEVEAERTTRGRTSGERPGVRVDARLEPSLHAAARYLTSRCRPDGSFEYLVSTNPAVTIDPGYNMLRHAGAIYALAQYYRRYPDGDVSACVSRAVEYLRRSAFGPVPEQDGLLAVWSNPELLGTDQLWKAKLGGAGLALAALLEAQEAGLDVTSETELHGLGHFILFMQKEDGSFYAKYVPSLGGRTDRWTSLYYPGEAALGLAMLYERDGRATWLDAAVAALDYLARSREGRADVEADHWALLATARVLPTQDADHQRDTRRRLTSHAAQICSSILSARPRFPATHPAYGALTEDGRTTPTSTRLEGLIAAYELLPDAYLPLKQQIVSSSQRGIDFLMRAQIWEPPYEGAIPKRARGMPGGTRPSENLGGRQASEIRIDYVQHAMSAMMGFSEMPAR